MYSAQGTHSEFIGDTTKVCLGTKGWGEARGAVEERQGDRWGGGEGVREWPLVGGPRARTQQDRSQPCRGGKTRREEHVSWEETLTRRNTCLHMEPSLPLHWGFCSSVASSVSCSFLFFQLTPSSPPRSVSSLSPHNQPSFTFHPPWPRMRASPHTPHLPTWRCHLPSRSGRRFTRHPRSSFSLASHL